MKKYVVRSNEAMVEYPALCKIRVALSKLYEAAAKQEPYAFDCRINGKNYSYLVPADVLLQTFICKRGTMDLQECVFYIGYATGALYCTPSQRGEDEIYRLKPALKEETCRETALKNVSCSCQELDVLMNRMFYKVRSATNRQRDGELELCWMDPAVKDIDEAADKDARYYFIYHHGEDDVSKDCDGDTYLYSIIYSFPAKELRSYFHKMNVGMSKQNRYRTYLNYRIGGLYKTLSCKEMIVQLDKEVEGVRSDEFRKEYAALVQKREKAEQTRSKRHS